MQGRTVASLHTTHTNTPPIMGISVELWDDLLESVVETMRGRGDRGGVDDLYPLLLQSLRVNPNQRCKTPRKWTGVTVRGNKRKTKTLSQTR